MERKKAESRTLEKREGSFWFGARVVTVLPTPVSAVVLISTEEPADATYDATHFVKSTEHYVSSSEFLQVATNGHGLTDELAGTLLASLIGSRHALSTLVDAFNQAQLAPIVDRLRGTEPWSAALSYARYVLERSHIDLDSDVDNLVLEQEHE